MCAGLESDIVVISTFELMSMIFANEVFCGTNMFIGCIITIITIINCFSSGVSAELYGVYYNNNNILYRRVRGRQEGGGGTHVPFMVIV